MYTIWRPFNSSILKSLLTMSFEKCLTLISPISRKIKSKLYRSAFKAIQAFKELKDWKKFLWWFYPHLWSSQSYFSNTYTFSTYLVRNAVHEDR